MMGLAENAGRENNGRRVVKSANYFNLRQFLYCSSDRL